MRETEGFLFSPAFCFFEATTQYSEGSAGEFRCSSDFLIFLHQTFLALQIHPRKIFWRIDPVYVFCSNVSVDDADMRPELQDNWDYNTQKAEQSLLNSFVYVSVCVAGITIETTHTNRGRVRLWEVPLSPLYSEVL